MRGGWAGWRGGLPSRILCCFAEVAAVRQVGHKCPTCAAWSDWVSDGLRPRAPQAASEAV
ncbi:hypothetical protein HMPREF9120_00453 [Neisseria sp. oral taxon 020 str. F0370]|nr:hypothetical protein HMPREF9120_00453 [Neisseria sp. oral taxon 020 str. F0370]